MRLTRLTSMVAAAALMSTAFVTPAQAAFPTLIVNGNGLNVAHLGTSENVAMSTLTRLLGHPTSKLGLTPGLQTCGVSASAEWYSLGVYFNHNRLVGISAGPGHVPPVRTPAGLLLGNTVAHARFLYGKKLTFNTQQGGAWFVATNVGRIAGFLSPATGRAPAPSAKILTMDVGVVGCPAMSP